MRMVARIAIRRKRSQQRRRLRRKYTSATPMTRLSIGGIHSDASQSHGPTRLVACFFSCSLSRQRRRSLFRNFIHNTHDNTCATTTKKKTYHSTFFCHTRRRMRFQSIFEFATLGAVRIAAVVVNFVVRSKQYIALRKKKDTSYFQS